MIHFLTALGFLIAGPALAQPGPPVTPIATTTTAGKVIVSTGLSVAADGTLTINGQTIAAAAGYGYSIGADLILTHPLTPTPDNDARTNISLGYGALASIAPIHSTQYDTAVGFMAMNSLTTEDHDTAFGAWALASVTNQVQGDNPAIGIDALRAMTTGQYNVAVGDHAIGNVTAASDGTAVGVGAMSYAGGLNNTAVGHSAMQSTAGTPVTGNYNTAVGASALYALAGVGASNTAVGNGTLINLTTATQNTAVGANAGAAITTGTNNTILGYNVGFASPTTGSNNVLIGTDSGTKTYSGVTAYAVGIGFGVVAGSNDVCIGEYSCAATGVDYKQNVGIGYLSLQAATTGSGKNVAVGTAAGKTLTTGAYNTLIGGNAGATVLTTGHDNIIITTAGNAATTPAAASSNEVNIANLLFLNSNSIAAPALSACGTAPTIDTYANNKSGTITFDGTAPASCTVTFAGTGYSTWNHCRVTPHTTLAVFGYGYTKTVLTITATALSGAVDYDCDGY